ncbi:hypothetical protein [Rhodococcus erythropolis]|uniref:hypothetical protein n=1 Tax=Rhodococcus erythropolis TaxID=1833 RepID=UPI001BE8930C|nr:hypothetical protein [Rhodococcus erythropolis]MBT2269868.1 hypothetical protein [Rhodococcus erythropolis]
MPRTPSSHVQQCAALICAYLSGDEVGCAVLRAESELTLRQWRESAIVLSATVMVLLAHVRGREPLDVLCVFVPERHEVFPGDRDAAEALAVIVYYHLHREILADEDVVVDLVPSLFDIAISAVAELAREWSRPAIEVARLLAVGAATYQRPVW